MSLALIVIADFEHGPLGGPSRLDQRVAGRAVLARTLTRAAQVGGCERRIVCTQPRWAPRVQAALAEAGQSRAFDVLEIDDGLRPRRELVRAARLWNCEGWRGTPLGTTWFDELVEPLLLMRLFPAVGCTAALLIDGHQPLLDVAIAERMLSAYQARQEEARFLFTQAPPGLAGIILTADAAAHLIETRSIVGQLMSYRPEAAQLDVITKPVCLQIDGAVAQTPGRWTADTNRSLAAIEAAIGELGESLDAATLTAWQRSRRGEPGQRPREIELELTTATPLPDSTLLSGPLVRAARSLTDTPDTLTAVERLGRQLAEDDDAAVLLGGHGDPLQHARFGEICTALRSAGVAGLAVRTPLVDLRDDAFEALFAAPVDVLQVQLDATSAAGYRRVHGRDAFAAVLTNVERVLRARRDRTAPRPLVIPSLTRCAATQDELEKFFDHWMRAAGWAVLEGYNRYGGRRPPDALLGLEPPVRGPCRRLTRRLMLLADGTAVACSEDLDGDPMRLGSWTLDPLTALWRGRPLEALRDLHARGRWHDRQLCRSCGEWFRP